jgi:hypothetical protein
MSSRTAPSKRKGKVPLESEYIDAPSSVDDNQAGPSSIDMQANLVALQNAQVNQTLKVDQVQKQMSALKLGMQQILAALNKPTSQPHFQTLQDAQIESDIRASPAPSSQSQADHYYRPKSKDPEKFNNNKGDIPCLEVDKFKEDQPQFPTERLYMRYLFGRTTGDANKHPYPRYTSEESNQNPYTSYQETFATLDAAFKNYHQVRDAQNEYRDLKINTHQSFHNFHTQFVHLANEGRIPKSDHFHDLYDKLTTSLQRQVVHQLHTMDEDFNTLCTIVAGIDVELKRISSRTTREKEAALGQGPSSQARLPSAPASAPGARMLPTSATAITGPTGAGFSLLQSLTTTLAPAPATPQVWEYFSH